ncbi:MAG TPA: acyltransferase [Mycobacteriales bacterium]|nr:acyltransferase [Mycobacteriales bacterium]
MTLQRSVTTAAARPERMSPTSVTRIDGLTGLRFFFALLVVCHHSVQHWFGPASYPVADFGYIGVDLFFVLSGFVLAWPSRPVRRGRFWWDRMSRVWPLHLLFLLVGLALIGYGVDRPTGGSLLANVVLVQAWFPSSTTYFSINAVSWSLSCELFFYLAFPWLIAWLQPMMSSSRRRVAALVVVGLAIYPGLFSLTIAPSAPGPHEWSTYVLPLWRMGEFLLGIIAALEVRDGWRPRLSGAAALWVMVAASAGLLADGLAKGHLPDRAVIEVVGACLAALAFAAVAADEVAGRRSWYAQPWMVTLGASSYALYLLHALLFGALIAIASWTGPGLLNPLAWAAYLLLAVALSIGVHRWIELPVERWLRAHRPAAAR